MIYSKTKFLYILILGINFVGCGGNNDSTISKKDATNNPPILNDSTISKKDATNNPPILIDKIMAQKMVVPYSVPAFLLADEALLHNSLPINITIQYIPYLLNDINKYYHAVIKSNYGTIFEFKNIGENFVSIDSFCKTEAAYRNVDPDTLGEDFTIYVNPLTSLWKQIKDKNIIQNSLVDSNFLANFISSAHSVSFTIQKDSQHNFNISNLIISNFNESQTQFVLKNSHYQMPFSEEYDQHFTRKLLLTLTTLFANFEKSKEILN